MIVDKLHHFKTRRVLHGSAAIAGFCLTLANVPVARADEGRTDLSPGNLLISRLVYDNNPSNVIAGTTQLPPNCDPASCVTATFGGSYPYVWNNVAVDGTFGITAKIMLDQLTPSGRLIGSLEVPNSSQNGVPPTKDQMVGSFSSKSEGALNLSSDGSYVTFMGYLAPIDALDVSNSNTPAVIDPTNPDHQQFYRVTAQLDAHGTFHFTKTSAFSGDNGRAVIRNDGANVLYAAGNAGNGGNPQPDGVIVSTGAQIFGAETRALVAQNPGLPTPVASFNITQLGLKVDKIGKDTNFRGIAIFDDVLYFTKGSGSNGINTVYFVDTSGFDSNGQPLACPNGVGLPASSAALPIQPLAYDPAVLQTQGLTPNNICILKGFPTATKSKTFFPFALWFADAKTVYVAHEGDGDTTFNAASGLYTKAAAQTDAGLQKWVFDDGTGQWKHVYTLNAGLNLGVPYTVTGYPSGTNPVTGLPWSPATDGLRNITGQVNGDGNVTIWAVTSTVSGNGDVGADPNALVSITDDLAATVLPGAERFTTARAARFGEVLRGVSFTPGTGAAGPMARR